MEQVDDTAPPTRRRGGEEKRAKKGRVEWWKRSLVYQVYPRSFSDSNGDGVGDLKGIISRLSYFTELGVGTVWLSPIFRSPMADFGYDISNFTDVDPIFGTIQDFENLVQQAHDKGLKVVMDLVPNHSSDEHEWFAKSLAREDPYTDYYVWAQPSGYNESGDPLPPNNWRSVFGGSAWLYKSERGEFYLHQFLAKQPDLNYRNPAVRQEMQDVIKFWMDKGVDGMRLDAVKYLYEVEDLSQDEPLSGNPSVLDPNEYDYLNHTLTVDMPETFDVIREWRVLLDQYTDSKLMMAEVYYDNIDTVMKYYGTEEEPLADFPFNFNLLSDFQNRSDVTGFALKASITRWLDNMPEGKWANWELGNHDNGRVASRLGVDLTDALNMVSLLLPGTAITYYGEEIGMEDTFISYEDTQDPAGCNWGPDRYSEFSRDPARTPMQWDDTERAGFTSGNKTWLPVNDNYLSLNVQVQREAQQSSLKVYRALAALRKEDVFFTGGIAFPVITEDIFSFVRFIPDNTTSLVVVNTGSEGVQVDMHQDANFNLPEMATVVVRSSSDNRTETEPGTSLSLRAVPLLAGEGLVLDATNEAAPE